MTKFTASALLRPQPNRYVALIVLLLSAPLCVYSQSYTIQTLAGGGIPADGPALSANLSSCWIGGLAIDPAMRLVISLPNCQEVVRLDSSGNLTRIAGTGVAGFAGDGGPAGTAELNHPSGLAIDRAGNLYIADHGNNRVRRVDEATGRIATIAGNGAADYGGNTVKATDAGLPGPGNLAVDSHGNLYISCGSANYVLALSASDGNLKRVAGGSSQSAYYGYGGDGGPAISAQIRYPAGLAVDAAGNLFFADTFNQRIRRIDATTGIVTTVAGDGTSGYGGDGGAATAAQLQSPGDVAVDAAGKLYIADSGNARVRMVDPANGQITSLASNVGASSVAVSVDGKAMFAAYWLGVATQIAAGTATLVAGGGAEVGDNGAATAALLSGPTGTAVDVSGAVYIWDTGFNRIRKVSQGIISTYAGTGQAPTGAGAGDGGPATAALLRGSQFQDWGGLGLDGAGNLYLSEAHFIRKIAAATGIITTVAGFAAHPSCWNYAGTTDISALTQCLWDIAGVTVNREGDLYLALSTVSVVLTIPVKSGLLEPLAGTFLAQYFSGDGRPAASATLAQPMGVALDKHGNVFIADSQNHRIRRVDAATGIITTVAGTATQIGGFNGYSGDGGPAAQAKLNTPTSVAVDATGNLFIADTGNNVIRKVDAATGIITTIAGKGVAGSGGDGGPAVLAQLKNPTGVSVDNSGTVYFSDSYNNRVRALIPSGGPCGVNPCPPRWQRPPGQRNPAPVESPNWPRR